MQPRWLVIAAVLPSQDVMYVQYNVPTIVMSRACDQLTKVSLPGLSIAIYLMHMSILVAPRCVLQPVNIITSLPALSCICMSCLGMPHPCAGFGPWRLRATATCLTCSADHFA